MKTVVSITKALPWVVFIAGVILLLASPPRTHSGDEDVIAAAFMLFGLIISSFFMLAFSYVVEAACMYLESKK